MLAAIGGFIEALIGMAILAAVILVVVAFFLNIRDKFKGK